MPDANTLNATAIFRQRRTLLQALIAAGTLPYIAGCATGTATSAPLDEESAFALGLEAYVYAYPMAYFARLRHVRMTVPDPVAKVVSRWNEWRHRSAVITPEIPGAPQTDTLYSSLWLDVRNEPVVLTIPKMDGRYWSIQCSDMLGTTYGLPNRRNLPDGGRVAVVGPQWKGTLPEGVQLLRTQMPQSYALLRLFFTTPEDRLQAVAFQKAFAVAPLSAYLRGETSVPGMASAPFKPLPVKDDPLADFKALQQMWQEAPPPAADSAVTARFARLGLGNGVTGFGELTPEARKGLERAEAEGRRLVTESSRSLPGTRTRNGWTAPRPRIGYYDDGDRIYRAAVTQAGTVAVPVTENPYYTMFKDPTGVQLNGDSRYELVFAKDQIPQVDAFWSLHAYTPTYRVIANAINRYSLGDRSQGLQYGADGSLTVYVQAEDPGEARRSNWLPVKRGEIFWLIVRAYEPQGAMKNLSWDGPVVRRLN